MHWTPKRNVTMSPWCNSRSRGCCKNRQSVLPIPGASSLAHLEENMAAEKLQLSAEEWKRIEDLARTS